MLSLMENKMSRIPFLLTWLLLTAVQAAWSESDDTIETLGLELYGPLSH